MSKYELTISQNYVSHWGVVEGVREFFQNAIDEQNINSEHTMEYLYENEVLKITSRNCKLSINSLLLGNTTKSDGKSIGQFGEGYKVAIVVLLREGKGVTIKNGDEIWRTRLVNSRRYKDKVVMIETSKFGISGNDLIVEIEGITDKEFENICNSNLHLRGYGDKYTETEDGVLLQDQQDSGNIYVEGLYIGREENFKFGYDFKSSTVVLNRDRNIISTFESRWNASSILCKAFESNGNWKDLASLIINDDYEDFHYIKSMLKDKSREDLCKVFNKYYKGKIPVTSQEEYDYFLKKGMVPVFVKEIVKYVYGDYYYLDDYKNYEIETSLYNRLYRWAEANKDFILDDNYNELINILDSYKSELEGIDCTE